MAVGLNQAQILSYHEHGYLLVERLFDASEVARALAAIDQILIRPDRAELAEFEPEQPSVPRRIYQPVELHSAFESMTCGPMMLDSLESLIGPDIVLHYSKLNMKAARVGSVVEWHQDLAYYPHTNTDLVSVLIHLDDAKSANGCLQVIPGSHKLGILDHEVHGFFRGKLNPAACELDLSRPTLCEAPAGSVLFLHCLTAHSSVRNLSGQPRRTLITGYKAADAYPIYYGSQTSFAESHTRLLRGRPSRVARMAAGTWRVPLAEADYRSLYELQEGSHVRAEKAESLR